MPANGVTAFFPLSTVVILGLVPRICLTLDASGATP